ncbi:acylphosphatase [Salinicoccus sp. YB14-2]|uniref:acylphosphatase n=1 Tax=Salinicoccus sp. YB14-2 TaxID=1572701 RepID=UPI00068A636A|nr:acylphosphatase [Salinicoccus sp. YB14-2]
MEAKLITLSGRVQGVGFRYHSKMIADKYGIIGYAKNLTEDVEIMAQGDKEAVEDFIEQVAKGASPTSRVDDYTVKSVETDARYKKFKTL